MKSIETLRQEIDQFINGNLPLWEVPITKKLVQEKYRELDITGINDINAYNTSSAFDQRKISSNKQSLAQYDDAIIFLEKPDFQNLSGFYKEHGLLPLTEKILFEEQAESKIRSALDLLSLVPECIACISLLVNCIQIISSEGPEYDTSYSHPDIPFTIFVSVCEDNTMASNIRVAESILHEAMHLKLSLIEHLVPMISDNSYSFFSPWRDEERPTRGVLHGLFVFRAILYFYTSIQSSLKNSDHYDFISWRIEVIESELKSLNGFELNKGLSANGAILARNLLPLS